VRKFAYLALVSYLAATLAMMSVYPRFYEWAITCHPKDLQSLDFTVARMGFQDQQMQANIQRLKALNEKLGVLNQRLEAYNRSH
jgi:hypothetical protein